MALQQLLARQLRNKGQKYTSAPLDVAGFRSFFMQIDADSVAWGTRNPAIAAPPDYEWGIEVSYNNFQTLFGTTTSYGCIGGRAKGNVDLPSFHLVAEALAIQPAGAKVRVYFKPLSQNMTVGLVGEPRLLSSVVFEPGARVANVVNTTQKTRVTGQVSASLDIDVANGGAAIIVNAFIANGGGSTVTISDADGTYTPVLANGTAPDASSQAHQQYFLNHTAGAHTIVVDPVGSSADIEFYATEVTGLLSAGALDSRSGQRTEAFPNFGGTLAITTAGTLGQADNLVVVLGTHTMDDRDFSAPLVGGVTSTIIAEQQSNSGGQCGFVHWRIISSTAVFTSSHVMGGGSAGGTGGILVGIYKIAAVVESTYTLNAERGTYAVSRTPATLTGPAIFLIPGSGAEVQRTGTTNPQTWTHTPAAGTRAPSGIVVTVVHGGTSTDHVTGITYGGVAMARAVTAADTATEAGRADIWWLGKNIPTGAVTISAALSSATADDIHFVSNSIYTDDGSDIRLIDTDTIQVDTANPSVTMNTGGRASFAIAALYGGGSAPSAFVPNANCLPSISWDLGNFYSFIFRQARANTADTAIGGTAAIDDVALAVASFTRQYLIQADPGAYTVTGLDATFVREESTANRQMDAAQGVYATTGVLADTDAGWLFNAAAGAYNSIGTTAPFHGSVGANPAGYGLTGFDTGLIRSRIFIATTDAYAMTGFNADLVKAVTGYTLAVDPGSYAVAGAAAPTTVTRSLSVDAGSCDTTGFPVDFKTTRIAAATAGAYATTGSPATFEKAYPLTTDAGLYAVAGLPAISNRLMAVAPSGHGVTGMPVTALFGKTLIAEPGGYASTGLPATSVATRQINAAAGGYSVTGVIASLVSNRAVEASSGAYSTLGSALIASADRFLNETGGVCAISGSPILSVSSRLFGLSVGIYTATGSDAVLEHVVAGHYALNTDPGIYTAASTPTAEVQTRILNAVSGTYAQTGIVAGLNYNRTLVGAVGAYSATGFNTGLASGRAINADSGICVTLGSATDFKVAHSIDAASGSYPVSGSLTDLEHFIPVPGEAFVLDAQAGLYTTSGVDPSLTIARPFQTLPGAYGVAGGALYTTRGLVLNASQGAYTTIGSVAAVTYGRFLDLHDGTYIAAGPDLTELLQLVMVTDPGIYPLTGLPLSLIYQRLQTVGDGWHFTNERFSFPRFVNEAFTVPTLPGDLKTATLRSERLVSPRVGPDVVEDTDLVLEKIV